MADRRAKAMPGADPHRLGLVSTRLHYFQLVARLGSIRRAAQTLNVAPSSISRVIAQLEGELETPLFERVRQRLKLTSAGELLVFHARASIAELAAACGEIDDIRGLRRGAVRIAVVESVARGLMPSVLNGFWNRHPGVTVFTKVAGSQQAFDGVAEGDCDVAIAFDVKTPRTAQRLTSATLAIGALVRPGHRIARLKQARLTDFAGEPLLLSDASLTLGPWLEGAMAQAELDVARRVLTNSIGLMIDLAVRGQGIALQTRVGAEREIANRELVFVPIRDARIRPRRLLLISRSRAHVSDATAALATVITKAIDALDES